MIILVANILPWIFNAVANYMLPKHFTTSHICNPDVECRLGNTTYTNNFRAQPADHICNALFRSNKASNSQFSRRIT